MCPVRLRLVGEGVKSLGFWLSEGFRLGPAACELVKVRADDLTTVNLKETAKPDWQWLSLVSRKIWMLPNARNLNLTLKTRVSLAKRDGNPAEEARGPSGVCTAEQQDGRTWIQDLKNTDVTLERSGTRAPIGEVEIH